MKYIRNNSLTLKVYSKDIYLMIKEYLNIFPIKTHNIHLISINHSDKFLASFVRGLFDTDGHHKKDGRLVLCLTSKKLIDQISEILKNKFKINSKTYFRKTKEN